MYTKLYTTITDALVKEAYIIIPNALEVGLSNELKNFSLKEKNFSKAGISSSKDLHIDSTKRRDKIHWLDDDSSSQSKYLNFAKGLQDYLNRELYLGLSYYETHLDSFKNSKNRIVTTVYYLNEDWKKKTKES